MDSIQILGFRLNTRYVIYGIVIWWLAMLIGYAIITFRSDRHKGQVKSIRNCNNETSFLRLSACLF